MSTKSKKLSEKEIDESVIARADDDSAWGKPIRVHKPKTAAVPLPCDPSRGNKKRFMQALSKVSNDEPDEQDRID